MASSLPHLFDLTGRTALVTGSTALPPTRYGRSNPGDGQSSASERAEKLFISAKCG